MTEPNNLKANGLWNHFTGKKKYTIECGKCFFTWSDKVPFMTDRAGSICPACGEVNTWSHSEWSSYYEKMKEFSK